MAEDGFKVTPGMGVVAGVAAGVVAVVAVRGWFERRREVRERFEVVRDAVDAVKDLTAALREVTQATKAAAAAANAAAVAASRRPVAVGGGAAPARRPGTALKASSSSSTSSLSAAAAAASAHGVGAIAEELPFEEDEDVFELASEEPSFVGEDGGADHDAQGQAEAEDAEIVAEEEQAEAAATPSVTSQSDGHREGTRYREALALLEEVPEAERDCEINWRIARLYYDLANLPGASEKQLYETGLNVARHAVTQDEGSSYAHKWLAICAGQLSSHVAQKQQVALGNEFRIHIERALEICPDDSLNHHLLGRWRMRIAALSWIEKSVCAAVFGKLPDVTYEDALDSFLKAERLSTEGWKRNMLWIAKAHVKLGQRSEAKKWAQKALQAPTESAADREDDEELQKI